MSRVVGCRVQAQVQVQVQGAGARARGQVRGWVVGASLCLALACVAIVWRRRRREVGVVVKHSPSVRPSVRPFSANEHFKTWKFQT